MEEVVKKEGENAIAKKDKGKNAIARVKAFKQILDTCLNKNEQGQLKALLSKIKAATNASTGDYTKALNKLEKLRGIIPDKDIDKYKANIEKDMAKATKFNPDTLKKAAWTVSNISFIIRAIDHIEDK